MASAPPAGLDTSVVPAVWARYTDLVVERGEGSWLITTDDVRYLDYSSGIGVTSTGHAHPRVVAAIQDQAARLLHGQQNIVYHQPGLELHARLARSLPGDGWSVFLSNSGAEAVEAAIKVARAFTKRPVIIAFRGGFHGRTGQTMALSTSRVLIRGDFEPLPGSVYHTPPPYCYRAPGGPHGVDACTCDWQSQLELLFAQAVDPESVAAVIVEPIIGEGGYVVLPSDFLPRLRTITERHGILLIADEVQTGVGRTGRLFAVEHTDVRPDILVFAKGIASGLPLSGIIARREILEAWRPGAHGGTFGGNVIACAAANATLDVIKDEGLVENARVRGLELVDGLRDLQVTRPFIGDVRGLGLMVGMEMVKPGVGDGRVPDPEMARAVIAGALQRRLIVLSAGAWGHVVRLIPPLVTTAEEVEFALAALAGAMEIPNER
jgi:4-aminobutyrate aminotransferase